MRKWLYLLLTCSLLANLAGLSLALWGVQRVGGISVIRLRLTGGGNTPHYRARTEHFRGLPGEAGGIVFVGDSITQRCEWAELLQDPRVLNRGVDGDKSTGVLARLDEIVARRPDAIFLMIGVNDLLSRSPAAVAETIGQIVRRLGRDCPATQLVVQSVLPVNNDLRQTLVDPAAILALNALVQTVAAAEGVAYLDLHSHFADDQGRLKTELSHDGIHLGGAGYELWKTLVAEWLPMKSDL